MWYKSIKELHIEPTSVCNAECPMCARNIYGKELNPYITLKSLPLKWFKDNIQPNQIKQLNKMFFCGNVGDPASAPELIKIAEYFKQHNPNIIVGLNTNGGLKTKNWWIKLGKVLQGPLDYCVFSIDGLENTNHIYRKNVKWQKIMENVEAFISTGASAQWDMLVFEHNKHQVDEAKQLAKEIGFTWFRSKETDRWDTYTKEIDINPTGHTEISMRPVNPYSKPDYDKVNIKCEKDRDSSIFLDYTGKFWPCCHMAEAYLNKIGYELHNDLRQYNNEELFTQYSTRLNNNTAFYICKRACGQTQGKRQQWKKEEELNENSI